MIEYYNVSGCYVLRPSAYFVWEQIQKYLDLRFKSFGVDNCYFPMFVTEQALSKEKNHIEGFAPEVAWVTKSGNSNLNEPIAIRPTSETIMYPSFSKWIHSHRDLPLLLNQWCNVVRWEFKHPTPFIRTREFLWQEGHTAHQSKEEAEKFADSMLDVYQQCYEEVLAIPTIRGRKTENEKFAGADLTKSLELYIPEAGRGLQAATSHSLGQNFAKMFDIQFENDKGKKEYAWQTSWGFTTRSIGAMVMIHSDDKGLVLPPKIAQYQIVIIPVIKQTDDQQEILKAAKQLKEQLAQQGGLRVYLDDRQNYSPGWKFNHWEVKGVPLRIEFGENEFKDKFLTLVRRDTGQKQKILNNIDSSSYINGTLELIHQSLLEKAKVKISNINRIQTWQEFIQCLNNKQMCVTPWCNQQSCENDVKERIKIEYQQLKENKVDDEEEGDEIMTGSVKTLCIPDEQSSLKHQEKCFACQRNAKVQVIWGRSF